MYDKIMNPETRRLVSIDGKLGKSVISKYLDYLIGGTSKGHVIGGTSQNDIPMNSYESLKELSLENFRAQMEELYSPGKPILVDSFDNEHIDEILKKLFACGILKFLMKPRHYLGHNTYFFLNFSSALKS